jgi:hypothetical protein
MDIYALGNCKIISLIINTYFADPEDVEYLAGAKSDEKEQFCQNCGSKIPAGALFCEQCGSRIGK